MRHPADITPLTYLDYPKKAACILWFTGCNLRCPYCYNPELVLAGKAAQKEMDEMAFLRERAGFLDAVVLSGGEATLVEDLPGLCERIHALGYLVKIDTNGSNPHILGELLERRLVDYVAMDNKMPSTRTWTLPGGAKLFERFTESLARLQASGIPYELRTTVHPGLLDEADILQMVRECHELGYNGTYYLQFFFNAGKTLGNLQPPTRRYDRGLLDRFSPLPIGYRNFPEDRGR